MYEIKHNQTPPRKAWRKEKSYPFAKMVVGDSVFIPSKKAANGAVRVAAHKFGKQTGARLMTKMEDDGTTVYMDRAPS